MAGEVAPALDLGPVRRSKLTDSCGRTYLEFRRELTPRWAVVWAYLLAGHLALLATTFVVVLADRASAGPGPTLLVGVAGAAGFGFWLHYLLLFQHEGVHYNLAPGRSANDRLTNAFIGVFIGEDVRLYRPVHLEHHRWLGTTRDTERSYFDPLDWRLVAEGLFGVRLIKALLARRKLVEGRSGEEGTRYVSLTFVVAAALNGTIVLFAWWKGYLSVAIAWFMGELVVLPMLNTLRQVLEHRSELADDNADYSLVDHGSVNRIFGSGPFTSTFGSAGFNRHLLHHWDPGVSFTRLRHLEEFLLDTEQGPQLRGRQTTYLRTLRQLAAL